MSQFNFSVVSCLVLVASVQSYVVREKVSFVDSADLSKGLTSKDGLLDKANEDMLTTTVETEDRDGLNTGNNKCAIGYRKAGSACLPDQDYSTSVETDERYGITGGFNKNCPEGYKRVDTSCVPHGDESKEDLNDSVPVEKEINKCPIGFKEAGPACIPDDYESYEDDS